MIEVYKCFYVFIGLLFVMIENIIEINCVTCTPNFDYANFQDTSKNLKICQNKVCKPFLEVGAKYDGCQFANQPIQHKFVLKKYEKHRSHNATLQSLECDSNSDGVWSSTNCDSTGVWTFVTPTKYTVHMIFVLSCGAIPGINMNTESEIAVANSPRFQIIGYDYTEVQTTHSARVYPTEKFRCVAQCKENDAIAMLTSPNGAAACIQDICYAKNLENTDTLNCGQGTFQTQAKIIVSIKLRVDLVSLEGQSRKSGYYDAGEFVSCNVTETAAASPTVYPMDDPLALIYVGKTRNDNLEDLYTRELPENSGGNVVVRCYFGNIRLAVDKNRYYQINTVDVKMKALFKTYITSSTSGTIKTEGEYAFDFPLSSSLTCDKGKYSSQIPISLFTVNSVTYPLSDFQTFPGFAFTAKDQQSTILLELLGKEKKFRYVTCLYQNLYTTPVLIYGSDRPTVFWWYVNPPWDTKYHLRKFLIVCMGENVEKVNVECQDCPANKTLVTIMGLSTVKTLVEVSEFASANDRFLVTCTGSSDRYPDVSIQKQFYVVESNYVDLDSRNKVYMIGTDKISCRAQFTIFDKGAFIESIAMMTLLYTATTVMETTSEMQEIMINSMENYPLFEYCCPFFIKNMEELDKSEFKCGSRYNIKVARTISFQWTPDLQEIFAGNILRCYICANFTHEVENAKCEGPHRIPSVMNIDMTYPDGTQYYYRSYSKVEMPRETINPKTQRFYDASDYKISGACLKVVGNNDAFMSEINLRSCNTAPPRIFIMPAEKTMFKVGEIFSCSTNVDECKDGLNYSVSIRRGITSKVANYSTYSYKFVRDDLGNDITIGCHAGKDNNMVSDRRVVRVEVTPFNITVHNHREIMIYKDYLYCSSAGFPEPHIFWRQISGRTRLRISEGMILIGPWDESGTYEFECTAQNKRGSLQTTTDFEIYNPRIDEMYMSTTFYVVVPVFGFLFIVIVMLSLTAIFMEGVFGVPFFSDGGAEAPKDSRQQPKPSDISEPLGELPDEAASYKDGPSVKEEASLRNSEAVPQTEHY